MTDNCFTNPPDNPGQKTYDLLASTVLLRPDDARVHLWQELVDRGRGQVITNDGVELWTTTEATSEARAALAGEHGAVVHVLRGHLELSGVTTADDLAVTTTLPRRVDVTDLDDGLLAHDDTSGLTRGAGRSRSW